jgi:Rps23 Pro-64 3,4-dihydroxylase Tpa1-like proline 4-hydroxylase
MAMKINGLYVQEKKPTEVFAGCIEMFENVWPQDLKSTINSVEQECLNPDSGISWQKAETFGSGVYQNIRTNVTMDITYLSDITNNITLQTINNAFYSLLIATSNSYGVRFNIQEDFFHENYQLLKYRSGEEYKAHYDGGTNIGRCISAICYLNDDYVGGELEFTNFNIKIKPKAGMMLLFPSNYAYRHIAHPVVSGTKYALVTWIRDRQT